MPYKDPEKQKAYRKKWHAENYNGEYAKKHRKEVAERKKNLREKIGEYKQDRCCEICGESELCCLDFHHLDSSKKEETIARLPNRGVSWETALKEIEKCIVVCSNCHRKIHAGIV